METIETSVLDLLNKSQALYSTEFTSGYAQSANLLESLLENMGTQNDSFFGTIYLQQISDKMYIVVDGLKRLISVSLLLYAICECYKKTNEVNLKAIAKINARYLKGKFGTKIQLSGFDKQIYEKIVTSKKLTDEEKQEKMFQVLHDYWTVIKTNNLSANKLFSEIKKMKVIVTTAEEYKAGNRELYNTLNFHSEFLDPIKVISDFIDENAGDDAILWYDILGEFDNNSLSAFAILFLRDYVTIQRKGLIPAHSELYDYFKKYFQKSKKTQTNAKIFENIKKYAKFYIKLLKEDFENENIKDNISKINELSGQETYAYLIELLNDYSSDKISDESFVEILSTINEFIKNNKNNEFSEKFPFASLSQLINSRMA